MITEDEIKAISRAVIYTREASEAVTLKELEGECGSVNAVRTAVGAGLLIKTVEKQAGVDVTVFSAGPDANYHNYVTRYGALTRAMEKEDEIEKEYEAAQENYELAQKKVKIQMDLLEEFLKG